MKKILLISVVLVSLTSCDFSEPVQINHKNLDSTYETGRYSIVETDVGVFLLNTGTGQTKRYVRVLDDDGELYKVFWEDMEQLSPLEVYDIHLKLDKHNQSIKR